MIHIRAPRADEHARLSQLYLECRQKTFAWLPAESFRAEDFAIDTEGEKVLVAVIDGQLVGFASVWTKDSFLHNLFVDFKFQKQSVGTQLLTAALELIGRPARLKCVEQNNPACRFYEKLGWKIESRCPEGPMGPYLNYVLH